MTTQELAEITSGRLVGDPTVAINGINRIEHARSNEITFLSNEQYVKFLPLTKAGCVIISESLFASAPTVGIPVIVADDAYRAFVRVMQTFFPPTTMPPGVRAATATIDASAKVADTASIGPGCVVGRNCVIADGVQLTANVVLYADVKVGANTVIHANVSCSHGTTIGERCIIHPGVVIGADGFGFFENPDGSFEKIPQVGTVVIGNDVEIGANTAIDRAAVGVTKIGDGVKLDNLIHIAHGVEIGANTAIAAQAGISGSARLGQRNRIAGQVGVVGHISTTDDVIVEAQSGLSKTVTQPGAYFGSPAKEHRTALRMEAALRRLPELLKEFQELRREVAELKNEL